jgi:hypothetical protein
MALGFFMGKSSFRFRPDAYRPVILNLAPVSPNGTASGCSNQGDLGADGEPDFATEEQEIGL